MVKSLIRVEYEVLKPNMQPKKETRYYISSKDFTNLSAREVAYYIKEYWGGGREPPSLAIGCDI